MLISPGNTFIHKSRNSDLGTSGNVKSAQKINGDRLAVELQLGVGRSDGFGLEILSLGGLVGYSSGMV